MSGVSALSAVRGGHVAAPNLMDTPIRGAERVDVLGSDVFRSDSLASNAVESVWALRTSWYQGYDGPRLDDWWWRRLDSFAADCDDPRIINLIERMRDNCLPDEAPFECGPVGDPPPSEVGIVELILSNERPWQEAQPQHRSNDLLVDIIHLQRSRW